VVHGGWSRTLVRSGQFSFCCTCSVSSRAVSVVRSLYFFGSRLRAHLNLKIWHINLQNWTFINKSSEFHLHSFLLLPMKRYSKLKLNCRPFASNLGQVANLRCAQVNSASYPLRDWKWVVAYELRGEDIVWLIAAVVCLCAAPRVLLFASTGNVWPHNALRYH